MNGNAPDHIAPGLSSEQTIAERVDEELKQCLDHAAEGLHWVAPDGTILWANQTELNLLGYTTDEYIGHNIAEFHVDASVIEDLLRRLTEGETLRDYQACIRAKDGSIRHVEINSNVLWRDDAFLHTRCFTRDVTDRKAADDLARRLADIVENSDDAIISQDLHGVITSWNPAARRMYGHTAGEAIGRSIQLTIPDDRKHEEAEVVRQVRHGERVPPFDTLRRDKDGRRIHVAITVSPIRDPEGHIVGASKIVRDISARKRLEARDRFLLELDDTLRLLTDAEAITFSAAKALGEHLAVNRCAYATVENDEDALVFTGNYTNGVESIVGRYTLTQFGRECRRMMRAGAPYVVANTENDPRITIAERPSYKATAIGAVVFVPILKQRKFAAAMAVHCATPRQWDWEEVGLVHRVASRCWESIERARVTQELRAANRAKDEFLAMLGHELRNPLSPILTALQLMKLRGSDGSERERTVIERQVNHLTRLVDDLLDVSRIARGQVELKEEIVEIAEVVAKAIEITSPLLEQRTHTLDVAVPRRGLFVKGDQTRLIQVMANLITNAAKYTPPGGHIKVAARDQDGDVVLGVRDSGIGIAVEILPRVFDLFVQGRQGVDRSQGGLGIGLTIVRNLVERHGGKVFAHSDGPGSGSEFVVRLPKAIMTAATEVHPSNHVGTGYVVAPAANATRILVVDDNVDGAEMLATVLLAKGYDTRVAHDAPAALRVAADFRPDVAFLDIGLPVMDGYELAVRLREQPYKQETRLIALTGYGQESDRQKAREAGFEHHLVKPVNLESIDALLSERRQKLTD